MSGKARGINRRRRKRLRLQTPAIRGLRKRLGGEGEQGLNEGSNRWRKWQERKRRIGKTKRSEGKAKEIELDGDGKWG